MTILGLDIGTTTLSAAVLDADTRAALHTETQPGAPFLPAPKGYERMQDPEETARRALALAGRLSREFAPAAIGLTGQMHGVVPLDASGCALGPLFTWQDGRGDLDEGGSPLARRLSEEIGLPLATGYGLVTHAFNRRHGLYENAASLATIGAYVGMRLTGRPAPLLHASDAASLGGYRADRYAFDGHAASVAGGALPESTARGAWLGNTPSGVPVAVSIGDNQASFLGAAEEPDHALLANIGTGGQISACAGRFVESPVFDTRPFTAGRYLLVCSSLCGGRSYAILERFFRACAALAGADAGAPLYEVMNRLAGETGAGGLAVDTRFAGTRAEPDRRGAITGLSEDNFTPAHLIRATLEGMARELFEGYEAMRPYLAQPPERLTASGNAVRRNPALRRILGEAFSLPVALSPWREEAARGAALFALALLRGEDV
ncbi:MAG: hypothetical protein IKO07_01790 [Clostridia bacterium]|nr:hypothetical protein [Clostridia bacterium]